MTYTIGTRGSRLSLAQTRWVADRLQRACPGLNLEIKTILTSGDRDSRPLFTIDQKGIFEKEIDAAVARGEVDLAVHSLKDVPSTLSDGLVLACVPARADPTDILITQNGLSLELLPSGYVIGTSSLRRAVQIRRSRPDISVKPIRGNVETRLAKIDGALYHGVVLARAGVARLGLGVASAELPGFLPSPGQGSLGVICRRDDRELISLLQMIEDANSRLEAEAERFLSDRLGSGCRFPLGALARVENGTMTLRAAAFSVDGKRSATSSISGDRLNAERLAERVADDLLGQGAEDLASGWREGLEAWNR